MIRRIVLGFSLASFVLGGCSSGNHPSNESTTNNVPTTSFSLSDWPAYSPAAATTLAPAANVMNAVTRSPVGLVVTSDGNWLLAATGTGFDLYGRGGIGGTTLTLARSFPAPAGETPFGLALSPDGNTVAIAMSDEVALYDLSKAQTGASGALIAYVSTHSTLRVSIDITFSTDGKFAFVALEYDNEVAVINVLTQTYVGAVPIDGKSVTGVVASSDGSRLYVTCEVANAFLAANPSPAVDQVVGSLTVIDVARAETNPTGSILGSAFVGRAPVRAILSPDGNQIWVTARGSNALLELNTENLLSATINPLLSTTAVGAAPVGLSFVDNAKVVAVADSNRFAEPNTNQTVMFVDASTQKLMGQIGVGSFPREMTADAQALFVSDFTSSAVSGISLTGLPFP